MLCKARHLAAKYLTAGRVKKLGKGGETEIGERLREGLGLTPRGRIWNCEEGLNSVEERRCTQGEE